MAVEETWALQNAAINAVTFRQALASLLTPAGGVSTVSGGELAVAQQSTPNMSVKVAPGRAWMPGSQLSPPSGFSWTAQGDYFTLNDASVTVTIASADPVNPRIDVVYIAAQDAFYSGSNNQSLIGVVTGTPAPSPSAPSAPSNSIVLANVAVAANATSIVNANITDKRPGASLANGVNRVYGTRTAAGLATAAYIDQCIPASSPWHTRSNGTNANAPNNSKLTVNQDCILLLSAVINYGSPPVTSGGGIALLIDSIEGDTAQDQFIGPASSIGGGQYFAYMTFASAMLNGESIEVYGRCPSVSSGSLNITARLHLTFIPTGITGIP